MSVRPMRSADLPDVAALLQSSFPPGLRPYMTYAQQGIGEYLAIYVNRSELFAERTYLVFVDSEDRAVGYAEFMMPQTDVQFLSYICVANHMRRRGVASSLIEYLLSTRPSTKRLELDVFDDNRSAIAMYLAMGFYRVDLERTWLRKPIPTTIASPTGHMKIHALHVEAPVHATYGFSELSVQWRGHSVRLGRIGPSVLRCFDLEAFSDDTLLAEIRHAFPHLAEAFLISDDARKLPQIDGSAVIALSTRMALKLAGPRRDGEASGSVQG